MGIYTCARAPPLPFPPSLTSTKRGIQSPSLSPILSNHQFHLIHITPLSATLNSPKGFGPTPKRVKKSKKSKKNNESDEEEEEEEEEDDREEGVIPEVGLKIDVPTWVPFIVSFIFFGTALLGVSYGIVSASWDPMREGSLLGWNEAQKNWPVFWQSIWGGSKKN
ncbi:UNVERIFIED_CONTAM: protein PAM68, chloroplastic [Sesamum angustifolium]|uniref:Protein PAM68, chloroplastic n=1 Tax=Sesamum angustifolium TaxID=2727405 RepID=A0AAW2MHR8_9LAMI